MDRNELEGKSKSELVTLGQGAGLSVTPAMNKPQLIDMLLANGAVEVVSPAQQLANIVANADDPEEGAKQAARLAEAAAKAEERKNPAPKEGALRSLDGKLAGGRKFRVTIMATEGETGDVKLGVNGHLVQIKRGVPVVLDEAYVEVLRNTVINTVHHNDNGERSVVQAVSIQRLPYQADPL